MAGEISCPTHAVSDRGVAFFGLSPSAECTYLLESECERYLLGPGPTWEPGNLGTLEVLSCHVIVLRPEDPVGDLILLLSCT